MLRLLGLILALPFLLLGLAFAGIGTGLVWIADRTQERWC